MGLHIYAHKAVSQWVISEAASSTGPEGHGSFTAQHQQTVVEVRTPWPLRMAPKYNMHSVYKDPLLQRGNPLQGLMERCVCMYLCNA